VVFAQVAVAEGGIGTADSIFLFQKPDVVGGGFLLEKLLIDAIFAVFYIAPAEDDEVNLLLGDSKSGGFFGLRFGYLVLLFFDGRQRR